MYIRKTKRPKLTIEVKVKTVKFFLNHGLKATQDAFFDAFGCTVSRSTLFSWRKEYNWYHNHGALLESLRPKSKRPKKIRVSATDPRIVEEIIRIRSEVNPIMGKVKIDKLLIPFCEAKGIKRIGITTIGKIIAKLKLSRAIPTNKGNFDVNINGKTGNLEIREIKTKKRKNKNRKPKGEKAAEAGDIVQIDAIMYVIGRIKRYFVVCIDLHTRVSYAKAYDTLNSANATDTLKEFQKHTGIVPKAMQTDNGLEYHKYFDEFLTEQNIKHYWNYPRSPKMNAFIERMNRTLEDEFIDWNLKALRDLKVADFNLLLLKYLHHYNHHRPHHSLQLSTPMEQLNKSSQSRMYAT
jgi:hypothetical protein